MARCITVSYPYLMTESASGSPDSPKKSAMSPQRGQAGQQEERGVGSEEFYLSEVTVTGLMGRRNLSDISRVSSRRASSTLWMTCNVSWQVLVGRSFGF